MRRTNLLVGAMAVAALLAAGSANGVSTAPSSLLVFASVRAAGDYGASADEFANLFMLRADGRGLRRLTTVREWESDPQWSPDGRQIAYSEGIGTVCHGGGCDIVPSSVIRVIDASGRRARQVTKALQEVTSSGEPAPFVDGSPTWSPDGRQLAFTHVLNDVSGGEASANDGIYLVGVDGQGLRRVLKGVRWVQSLDWSPDGKTLAFTRRDGKLGLLDLRTANVRFISRGLDVSWSPNGRSLAVTRDSGIYVVPARGGAARSVVNCLVTATKGRDLNYCGGDVSWSPDGRQLAISASNLFLARIDGSGLRRITDNPHGNFSPDWRP